MNEEERIRITELLDSLPAKFQVFEKGIDKEAVKEYDKLTQQADNIASPEAVAAVKNWRELSAEALKDYLVGLSMNVGVEEYRKIEEIVQQTEAQPSVNKLAVVCLQYARLFLEHSLTDEAIGFISGGLGGKDNKMRYYIGLHSEQSLSAAQVKIIEGIFEDSLADMDSELEEIEHHNDYVLLRILGSFEYTMNDLVLTGLQQIDFLAQYYLATNAYKPDESLMRRWINNELTEEDGFRTD